MPISKSERLINLVICLLDARQYVTKERLREILEPYRSCESDSAFERMFERDKDELRELGIPIETGSNSAVFTDEVGYRISPGAYALPEISLEPDEAAVLGLAARVWEQPTVARAASAALRKLAAAGVEVRDRAVLGIEPRIAAGEAAFEPVLAALCERRGVTFAYRRSNSAEVLRRRVDPWGIASWHGRWYLSGYDHGRADERVFRLDRIVGDVVPTGPPGAVSVPPEVDIRRSVARFAEQNVRGRARLRVRAGMAYAFRRRAEQVHAAEDGWDELDVPYTPDLDTRVAEYGGDVVVLAPPELRAAVAERLAAVAGDAVADGAEEAGEFDEAADIALAASAPAPAAESAAPRRPAAGARVAAGGAAEQVSRLLALVPYLHAHQGTTVAELARLFDVSEKRVRADLDLLWFVGLPEGLADDLMEVHISEGGAVELGGVEAIVRPLRLDAAEAVALLTGLRTLAAVPGMADRNALLRTIAKLEDAAGDAAVPAARVDVSYEADPAVRAEIERARMTGRRVHLRYHVPSRDEITERDVDPIAVHPLGGYLYLEGWCRSSEAVRLFRLDRVDTVEVLDAPAEPPADVQPTQIAERFAGDGGGDVVAVFDLAPMVRWVVEYFTPAPGAEPTPLPDGGLRARLVFRSSAAAIRLALRLGGQARLVAPEDLRALVRKEAQTALAAYEGTV